MEASRAFKVNQNRLDARRKRIQRQTERTKFYGQDSDPREGEEETKQLREERSYTN